MSDQRLTGDERLKSAKQLGILFKEGRSFVKFPLRFVWMPAARTGASPARVAFSVPRRKWKRAVDRNLLKRRMREAYRLQKESLYNVALPDEGQILIACIYLADTKLAFEDIKSAMRKALKHLASRVQAESPNPNPQ